ncbi:MAG: hypothetical protein A2Y96_00325 [Firmicutes bacterium RBG_13_65_8]|nr:MAG: hypothetical protein A2Y96_00325 [Firmicutes bacterium RBG_13_65_8]
MTKTLGLAAGFVLIVILVIRKRPLALAMALGTLAVGLGTGLGLNWLARTWGAALVQKDTLSLAAMVASITLLSYIMAVSGLHERLVNATIGLLRSAKLAVMVIPPLIGSMPIPGGAIVSAPLVDRPGDLLGLSQARKAAINLVFRHANFFMLPFSSPVILASMLTKFNVYYLLRHLAPLGLVTWIAGYFVLVRGTKEVALEQSPGSAPSGSAAEVAAGLDQGATASRGSSKHLREFLVSGSPILAALGISLALKVPFWIAVVCGIILALGLTRKSHAWALRELVKGVDCNLIASMFAIMGFRGVVVGGQALSQVAEIFKGSSIPLPVLAFAVAFLISTVSANHNTTLGIAYPMIFALISPGEVMAYAVLIFAGSFVAYFWSPLHLCQILTLDYCKVSLPQVFREYAWVLVALAAASWGLFYLYLPRV